MDDPIGAVAYVEAILKRLKMNVGGMQLNGPGDDAADQANDRGFAGQVFQVFDKITATGAARPAVFIGIVGSLFFLGIGQGFANVGFQRQGRCNLQPGGQAQGFGYEGVLRYGHGHLKHALLHSNRANALGLQKTGLQARYFGQEIRKVIGAQPGHAQLFGQNLGNIGFGNHAKLHQDLPQQAAQLLLRLQRIVQVSLRQFACSD